MFGVCCTNPITPAPDVDGVVTTEPSTTASVGGRPKPGGGAIPDNWPPPIPTHPPDHTVPPLPTHPPGVGQWPTQPPSPPTTTTTTTTPKPSKPPAGQWPPTQRPPGQWPPTQRPPGQWPPTQRPPGQWPVQTKPPATSPPQTTTTAATVIDASCGAKNGYQDQERIVGGQNADLGEWPWIVCISCFKFYYI